MLQRPIVATDLTNRVYAAFGLAPIAHGSLPHPKTPRRSIVRPGPRRHLRLMTPKRLREEVMRTNLTARAGRWSASHWKTATFGWIAFVVAAVVIGVAIGTKQLNPNTTSPG